jgi:hypothetical protein
MVLPNKGWVVTSQKVVEIVDDLGIREAGLPWYFRACNLPRQLRRMLR